jgi:hypothetical protein
MFTESKTAATSVDETFTASSILANRFSPPTTGNAEKGASERAENPNMRLYLLRSS